MASVKKVTLSFPASGSPDVVGYKLYVVEVPAEVDAVDENGNYVAPSYDIGNVTEIDMSTVPGMTTNDGVYNIGVTAVDDVENESSMSKAENVPLDFVQPDSPGELVITRL